MNKTFLKNNFPVSTKKPLNLSMAEYFKILNSVYYLALNLSLIAPIFFFAESSRIRLALI